MEILFRSFFLESFNLFEAISLVKPEKNRQIPSLARFVSKKVWGAHCQDSTTSGKDHATHLAKTRGGKTCMQSGKNPTVGHESLRSKLQRDEVCW